MKNNQTQRVKVGIMARGLTRGGVTRFINNLLLHLDRADQTKYQFVLFCDDPGFATKFVNIKVVYQKNFNKLFWETFQILPDLMREKPDVMLYPKNTTPLTHHLFRFKKVIIIHDVTYYHKGFREYKFLDTQYLRSLTPISCRKAAKVLTVSQATKNDVMRIMGLPSEKIDVIYEALSEKVKKIINQPSARNILLPLNIRKPYLLYCGTLSPRKNILRVLQAFEQVKDRIPHQFYITYGESWHDKKVKEFIQEHLSDRVTILAYVSDAQLIALYRSASLFLYPSLFEGFGLPILEAQACDCPVLTANTTSCPEVAGNGAHIVDPYSVEDIRDGMMAVLTNEKYRKELIERGRGNLMRFSWAATGKKVLDAVDEITSK